MENTALYGGLNGMGSVNLPFVDAVTAVEDSDGRVVLIGVGEIGSDRRTTQFESLWNIYHMRSNGVIVDDVAKDVGGKQSFTVTDDVGKRSVIPLKFNGDIMTFACRIPTDEELLALKINWITPSMEEVTPQSIRRAKRVIEEYQIKVPEDEEEVPEEEVAVHDNTNPKAGKGERTV